MIFWLAIFALTIASCGAIPFILLRETQRVRAIELIGGSVAIGCGIVPILLFLISFLFRCSPSRGVILILLAIALATIGGFIFTSRFPRITRPLIPRFTAREIFALPAALLIATQLIMLTAGASLSTFDIDAIGNWGLKAKVLFYEPLRPRPAYFSDLTLSYTHLDYPLLVPLLWAGGYGAIGHADEIAKLVLLVPVVGIVLMIYSAMRSLGRAAAMLLAAISISAPAMTRWAAQGLADATLALFVLISIIFLIDWIRTNRPRRAIFCGAACGFAIFTKLEGNVLAIAVAIIFVAGIFARRFKGFLAFAIGLIITAGPWWIWGWNLPRTHENYASRLSISSIRIGLKRLPQIAHVIDDNWKTSAWIAPILVLIFAAIIGWRGFRKVEILAAWFVLLTLLLGDLIAYLITPWNLTELIPITLDRLLLQVCPLAMLIVGLHWRAIILADDGTERLAAK